MLKVVTAVGYNTSNYMVNEVILSGRFVAPEIVVSHFHLRPGDNVADFGAGRGTFSFILAKVVGPTGKVYACEIQKNLVETLAETARKNNTDNLESIWCDIEADKGTKLESDSLDAAILVNTLFQMEEKEVALNEIKRVLRQGGNLFIIDWSESFGGLGPSPESVINEIQTKDLVDSLGYQFERSFDAGDYHYGLVFKKP